MPPRALASSQGSSTGKEMGWHQAPGRECFNSVPETMREHYKRSGIGNQVKEERAEGSLSPLLPGGHNKSLSNCGMCVEDRRGPGAKVCKGKLFSLRVSVLASSVAQSEMARASQEGLGRCCNTGPAWWHSKLILCSVSILQGCRFKS